MSILSPMLPCKIDDIDGLHMHTNVYKSTHIYIEMAKYENQQKERRGTWINKIRR